MSFSLSPQSIARASARRPWIVVGAWVVLLIVSMGLIGQLFATATTTDATVTSNPDSIKARNLLEDRLRGPERQEEAVIIRSTEKTVDDPAFRAHVEDVFARIKALGPEAVEGGTTFYESQNAGLVSADRHTTIVPITMAGDYDDASDNVVDVIAIVEEANAGGFEVYVSGNASVGHDFGEQAEKDIAKGETIGGVIALIILLLVFGALVAAVIPLILAVVSIIAAIGVTAVVGQISEFSFFVQNMITMMGLAVGIDYTLFVLSRFREERARGAEVLDAVDTASATAGRAVLFSGITVIIALMGLLIIPSSIYRSLAAGAIFVVGFAILASLTLLPAIMRLLGDRVNALRLPFIQKAQQEFDEERPGGFWDRVAKTVMAHPVIGAVAVTAVLIAFAIPYFDINTGQSGVSTLPSSFQTRAGFEILEREFAGGQVYPAEVVLDGDVNSPAVRSGISRLQQLVAEDASFGPATVEGPNQSGDLTLVSIQMAVDPYAEEATGGIERLRNEYIPQAFGGAPVQAYVGGLAAFNLDGTNVTESYTPIVFVFVLGLSFLLLMVVFRSIIVPAKAIVMNLLSVGAAYGLIVLVSQKGFGADVLGFQQVDTVEFWLPLFLFSILFGLSMDYHVFLLSRIRERYDQTNDNSDAVAFGLRSTGRLITGAALIMVAVFGGFAMGDLVMLQQMGFGLGVAVLIDATIIRSVLVPSTMKLLGRWNWYLPPVLSWLPHLGIEAPATVPARYVPEREPTS